MLNTSADPINGFSLGKTASPSVPLVGNPELEAKRLAFDDRLEAVLRGTANAYGALAAEFWLLDNPTKQLNCRVDWNKADPFANKVDARPLATADADVAAMAGGIVALEHPAEILQWHCHRPALSAVCLPVSSDKTIHGTLWLFFDRQKEFCNRELEMLEIVSGRLAVEIERDALLNRSAAEINSPAEMKAKTNSNGDSASVASPDLSELEIANWTCPSAKTAEGLWCQLPNGKTFALSSSVIATPGTTVEQAAQAIEQTNELAYELAKHAKDAGGLLTELNQRLIADSKFNAGVTIAVALLDAEGTGTVATAGPSVLLQVRAATLQSILGEATPLAWDDNAKYESSSVELLVRERLLLLAGTPRLSNPLLERKLTDTFRAPTADAHRAMSAQNCIERLLRVESEELEVITAIRRV